MFKSIFRPHAVREKKTAKHSMHFAVDASWTHLIVFTAAPWSRDVHSFLQFNLGNGNFVHHLKIPSNLQVNLNNGQYLQHLTFNPNGSHIASRGANRPLLWNIDNGHFLNLNFRCHNDDAVEAIKFSPNGQSIVYWSRIGKRIHIYDIWTKLSQEILNDMWVNQDRPSVSFEFENNSVIKISQNENIFFWDLEKEKFTIEENTSPLGLNFQATQFHRNVITSSDGKLEARDDTRLGDIKVRDVQTKEILHSLDLRPLFEGENLIDVNSIDFVKKNKALLVGFGGFTKHNPIEVDLVSRKISKRYACPENSTICHVRVNENKNMALTMSRTGDVYLLRMDSGAQIHKFPSEMFYDLLSI